MNKYKFERIIREVKESSEGKNIVQIEKIKLSIMEHCGTDPKTIRNNLKVLYALRYIKPFLTGQGKESKKLVVIIDKDDFDDSVTPSSEKKDHVNSIQHDVTESKEERMITSIPPQPKLEDIKDVDDPPIEEEKVSVLPKEDMWTREELWEGDKRFEKYEKNKKNS